MLDYDDCKRTASEESCTNKPITNPVSDEVLSIIFAFSDAERRNTVRQLASKVKALEDFVKQCRDDFPCDPDAHKYKTKCRTCEAFKVMPK